MSRERTHVQHLKAGTMKVEVHPSRKAAGIAAAQAIGDALADLAQHRASIGVIFAAAASQLETLDALTAMPGLPWDRVIGSHMDEYIGISADHPASFRRFLREHLTRKVTLREFLEMNGTEGDPQVVCREYARQLRSSDPQLCLLGIGENGHLAFNDPPVADFNDPLDVKVVQLDEVCRQQQTAEGWFKTVEDVPTHAISLTVPALLRVPKLIASVPGPRKAHIISRTLQEQISTACPSTILRTHPDVTLFLDVDSAAELDLNL